MRTPLRARTSRFISFFTAAATMSVVASFATPANAHISLEQGMTHLSRYGDGNAMIKEGPCGVAGGTRGTNIYTYKPNETVTITISEYIPHPSYFRIAFDNDGDDDFVPPASIEPIDPMRMCPLNPADKCGASDYYNSPTVLPDMDNLNPHMPGMPGTLWTWEVKMPNLECDNCTLQIIQVMEDTIHGAYNPVKGDPDDNPYIADIYYQCIDLVLSGPVTVEDAGKGDKPVKEETPAKDSSSCSVAAGAMGSGSSHAGALALSLAVGGLSLRRRRGRGV